MIILNKNNSKKIYGNRYLYNLVCDENINIKKLVVKSNLKKNITLGFIGKKDIYNLNMEYEDDETIIDLNINLLKGYNYVYIYSININFEIIIDENIKLGNIKYKIFNSPYILNNNKYYDMFINKNKLYFLAYLNNSLNTNFYQIKINENTLNEYFKYDNFYNFIGNINIIEDKLYTVQFNMKSLIPVINFIIIYDNIIEDKTSYDNNLNNLYNMNPIIAYKDIELNSYYIEVKFKKYDNNTRLSFDKDNKIILKIINNIIFINNKKFFKYSNQYLKIVFSYNIKTNNTEIYLFNEFSNDLSNRKIWDKIIIVNYKINFYQKFYETQYYDSHINKKIIILRKAFIFNCNTNTKKYLDNIDFKYYDNIPLTFLNNYKLQIGGDINKNDSIQNINAKLNIINKNEPASIYTIDSSGNKIIKNCINVITNAEFNKEFKQNIPIIDEQVKRISDIQAGTTLDTLYNLVIKDTKSKYISKQNIPIIKDTKSKYISKQNIPIIDEQVKRISDIQAGTTLDTLYNLVIKDTKSKYISSNNMNINKYFNNILNSKFLFDFDEKNPDELLKAIILISIIIVIYIKIFN